MRCSIAIALLLLAAGWSYACDEKGPHHQVIDVTDTQAIRDATDQQVVVRGIVERAEWSHTGKVMNIEFKGAADGLLAVVFERQRERLDEAFAGDLAKVLTGANVRLRGTITPYGGHVEAMKGRPQLIIEHGSHITITELAPTAQPG